MRLCLVDLSGIFRAQWHASADEERSQAAEKTVTKIASLRDLGCDHVVLCADSAPYERRLALLPTYKGQREKPSEVMLDQFRRVKERLMASGMLLWRHKGEEADDVIASVCASARQEKVGVTIASSDKDLLQLVDDAADIDVYNTSNGKRFKEAQVVETWHVRPAQLLDSLSLQGDTSDNVPGLKGIGPVKAAKLLEQFGSFDAVFLRADEIKQPAVLDAVANGGDAARLARKVIALRSDLPIPWDDLFKPRTVTAMPEETPAMNEPADAEFDDVPISPPPVAPVPPVAAPSATATPEPARVASTAIVRAPLPFEMQLEPQSLKTAQDLSLAIFNSAMYPKLQNKEAIQVVIMRGRSLGLTSIQALDVIHYFEGKTALHAHLIAAMCERSPDHEYTQYVGGDDTYAEYRTKHRKQPEPVTLRYTIEQAKQAGLCPEVIRTRRPEEGKDSRGMWEKRPNEQLRKTCKVHLYRIVFPGEAIGLYSLEELGAEVDS